MRIYTFDSSDELLLPFDELSHLSQRELFDEKMYLRIENENKVKDSQYRFSDYFKYDRELVFMQKPVDRKILELFSTGFTLYQ